MTQARDLKLVLDALDKVDLVMSDSLEPQRARSEAQMAEVVALLDTTDLTAAREWLARDPGA